MCIRDRDEVGEVCLVQVEREVAYGLGIVGLKGGFDGVQEVGAERPLLSRKVISSAASCIPRFRSRFPKGLQAGARPPVP